VPHPPFTPPPPPAAGGGGGPPPPPPASVGEAGGISPAASSRWPRPAPVCRGAVAEGMQAGVHAKPELYPAVGEVVGRVKLPAGVTCQGMLQGRLPEKLQTQGACCFHVLPSNFRGGIAVLLFDGVYECFVLVQRFRPAVSS
jgi:hypothetical protein